MTTAQVTVLFAGLTLHLAPVVVETGVQVGFFFTKPLTSNLKLTIDMLKKVLTSMQLDSMIKDPTSGYGESQGVFGEVIGGRTWQKDCRSVGLAIDNTGSSEHLLQVALALVEGLPSGVPSWTVATFNDVSEEIADENVKFVVTTDKLSDLRQSLNEIDFAEGGMLRSKRHKVT